MFDWKITLKKFGEAAGAAMLLAGLTALITGVESGQTLGAIATGVGLALLRTLQNYIKNRGIQPSNPFPPETLGLILFVGLACATFSGCATTHQAVKTMEGDTFSQTAFSSLGKQSSEQDISAKFGNSQITVGGNTDQDSTAMVPMIQALVGALMQQQQAGGGDTPERGRLEALEAQIAALRRIIETLRPVDTKWK